MTKGIDTLSKDEILTALISGKSFKDILEVDDEKMELWKKEADNLLETKKYDAASELLSVLTSLDPYSKDLWGMAAKTSLHKKEYNSAILAVSFAIAIEEADPVLHLLALKILHAMDDIKGFKEESELLDHIIKNRPPEAMNILEEYGMSIEDLQSEVERAFHR